MHKEFCRTEWLGDIIIRAKIESFYLFMFICTGRDDDDWTVGSFTNLPDDCLTIHIREPKIKENEIWTDRIYQLKTSSTGYGGCYFIIVPI